MQRVRRMAVGVAAVLLLAGCGDGDDESSTPATTTTTAAPATTTTLSQAQLDQQRARRIVFTAADLPGYTEEPPDPTGADVEFQAARNACVDNELILVQLANDDDPRGASSPEFSTRDDVSVSAIVTFAESEDHARSGIAALSAASFPGCLSRAVSDQLKRLAGVTNVTVSTSKLPALRVGDQSVGFRALVRFRFAGTAHVLNADFTFIRAGRAFALLLDDSAPKAFPEAERVRLATLLAGRMAAP